MCNIFKDYIDATNLYQKETKRINLNCSNILRSINVFSNVLDMWTFIMSNEASLITSKPQKYMLRPSKI